MDFHTGVRGFRPFIEQMGQKAYKSVNIIEFAKEYTKNTGKAAVLVVDVCSCAANLYYDGGIGYIYGKQYRFIRKFLSMIEKFNKNKIMCKFVFHGDPLDKEEEESWLKRRCEDHKLFNTRKMALKNSDTYSRIVRYIKFCLQERHGEIYQTFGNTEHAMFQTVCQLEGFGILTEDYDFILPHYIGPILSAKYLNPNDMTTRVIERKNIASLIGIDEAHLPLLAAICGNNPKHTRALHNVHLKLLTPDDRKRFKGRQNIPGSLVFSGVTLWIQRNMPNYCSEEKLSTWVAKQLHVSNHIPTLSLAVLLQEIMDIYLTSQFVIEEVYLCDSNYLDWRELLKMAVNRHRFLGAEKCIVTVMTRQKFYQRNFIEYYSSDKKFLPSHILLKKLRCKLYGILLKERPEEFGSFKVKEWVSFQSVEPLCNPFQVEPEFPPYHPGLKNLWGSSIKEFEKLQLFCWSISSKLIPTDLEAIPKHVILPCLALFYLINEVKSGFLPLHIKAFLICVSNMSSIKEISVKPPSEIELHLSTIFSLTCFSILALNDACGRPLRFCNKVPFFDAESFHVICGGVKAYEDDCLNLDALMKFIYHNTKIQ